MKHNNDLLKNQLKALKLFKNDLDKLLQKALKKRDKELVQFNEKTNGISSDELADLYGYGEITEAEYQEALKRLENNEQQDQEAIENTPIAQYVKMLHRDIRSITTEIFEIEEDLKAQ